MFENFFSSFLVVVVRSGVILGKMEHFFKHIFCRIFEFVKLAPKNGQNGPEQLSKSNSCYYTFAKNDFDDVNKCYLLKIELKFEFFDLNYL